MFVSLRNLFFFSFISSVLLNYASAEDDALTEVEKIADELLLDKKLQIWQLLDNANARNVLREFFLMVQDLMEDENSQRILTGIVMQIKNTLTNEKTGTISVKYMIDSIYSILTDETANETIKAVLDGALHTMENDDLPSMLAKKLDFFIGFVRIHRGAQVISALGDGLIWTCHYKNPRETYVKAFKLAKYAMSTSLTRKITDFIKG